MRARLILAAAILLLCAGAASAATFRDIFEDFKQDGSIDACKYTPEELRRALGKIPPDIEQYAPALEAAIRAALERHARGECDPRSRPRARERAAPPVFIKPRPPRVPPPPAPPVEPRLIVLGVAGPDAARFANASDGGGSLPGPLWALAILTGLGLLTAGGLFALHRSGFDLARRTRPLGASLREAGERAGDFAAELGDWVRTGR